MYSLGTAGAWPFKSCGYDLSPTLSLGVLKLYLQQRAGNHNTLKSEGGRKIQHGDKGCRHTAAGPSWFDRSLLGIFFCEPKRRGGIGGRWKNIMPISSSVSFQCNLSGNIVSSTPNVKYVVWYWSHVRASPRAGVRAWQRPGRKKHQEDGESAPSKQPATFTHYGTLFNFVYDICGFRGSLPPRTIY